MGVAELQGALPLDAAQALSIGDIAGNVAPAFDAPGRPMLGHMANDVPLYGTAMGGDGNGEFEMNGTVIDHVARPPGIYGRGDVFALNVVGDSMWPWRKPNSLIYVERDRAPSVNDHVVVEFRPIVGSSVRQTVVKLLVGISVKTLKLAQYRPAKEFDVDRRTVFRVYRVLEWDEIDEGWSIDKPSKARLIVSPSERQDIAQQCPGASKKERSRFAAFSDPDLYPDFH